MAFIKNQQGEQKLHSFEKLGEKQFETVAQPQTITTSVPLVFMKKIENGNVVYRGFVPGIVMKDVISSDLEKCKQILLDKAKDKLKAKIQLASPMPYFPENQEILKGYDDVCLIKRIKFSYREYQTKI